MPVSLIVAVQLEPRKILLHKQRIPVTFTIIGINCTSKQFLFRLQPDIILGLNNFAVLISGQLPYRLDNSTKFIGHILIELAIQECTSIALIPARELAIALHINLILIKRNHIPTDRSLAATISKIIMVKVYNLIFGNKPIFHVILLSSTQRKEGFGLASTTNLINPAPRKRVKIMQREIQRKQKIRIAAITELNCDYIITLLGNIQVGKLIQNTLINTKFHFTFSFKI